MIRRNPSPVTDPFPAFIVGAIVFLCGVLIAAIVFGESPRWVFDQPTPAQSQPNETDGAPKQEASILADKGGREAARVPLRQQIKAVVYSMDGCRPCKALKADILATLPKLNWKVGEAKDFVEACKSENDICLVHQSAGTETFDLYPTVAIYRNGMMIRRYTGFMSAAEVARRWVAVYDQQLTAMR